ncbi:MAG: thioredoxin family protein [Pseudomonadota bacterium]
MVATETPKIEFGATAPPFALPGTDGRSWDLGDIRGVRGTLVMFICNHCPYVKTAIDRIVSDGKSLLDEGVGVVAICSNDAVHYPDDSFPNMVRFAEAHGFPFPYLHDEDQSVAQSYGAVCTPDFFGFNAKLELQYRGRLDAARMGAPPPDLRRDLLEAMRQIARSGQGPADQIPSIGCSIKWKAA